MLGGGGESFVFKISYLWYCFIALIFIMKEVTKGVIFMLLV